MDCCSNKTIKIYKGFPTHFSGRPLVVMNFTTDLAGLTGYKAYFTFQGITKEFDDITVPCSVDFTAQETSGFDLGLNYADIVVEDPQGYKHPFSTAIPVMVVEWQEGDIDLDGFEATITTDIQENTIVINFAGGTGGTLNHDELLHRDYDDQHPISAITGLEDRLGETETALEQEIQDRIDEDTALGVRIDGKQDEIEDLDTIRSNASAGKSASDTIANYGNIVTHNTSEFATSSQGEKADTALQPSDLSATSPIAYNNKVISVASGYQIPTTTQVGKIGTNETDIATIKSLIPGQATSSNQLADKSFVNSTVGTNTSNYISNNGQPFTSLAQLQAYTGTVTNNDYAFITGTDEEGNTFYDRYKATVTGTTVSWAKEYRLNNSSFTASQWASIQSGITSDDVALIGTALQPQDNVSELTNDAGYITGISSSDVTGALGYTPANDSAVVKLTGNQTVGGYKTFTSALTVQNEIHVDTQPNDSTYLNIRDTATDGEIVLLNVRKSDNAWRGYYALQYDSNTDKSTAFLNFNYTRAPTPTENTTSSTQIDTVGARNTKLSNYRTSIDQNVIDATKQPISTALNYDNISNCITEIPQDIKLELNNGTLTLQSGSKVYSPNGAGVFDFVNITSDKTTTSSTGGKIVILTTASGSTLTANVGLANCVSGSTDSLLGTPYHIWYDTTNNVVNYYGSNGTTPSGTRSFPIAIATVSGGKITSIDQVFNGFGYIGSTVFALPGVKGLIPNGRNADGSLKNTEFTTSSVKLRTDINSGTYDIVFDGNTFGRAKYDYDFNNNYLYYQGNLRNAVIIGKVICESGGKITSFIPKTPFHAVDYNDYQELKETKQDALVSGTNIKTINGNSILGSGDITISGGSSSLSTLTDVSLSSPANGQFLSYNGSKWANTSLQTTLSSSSTDNQVPSAKCVYDLVGNVEALINAL